MTTVILAEKPSQALAYATIFDNFRHKKLTKTNLMDLINGKETVVKGVRNKDKTKTYNVVVKLIDGKFEQQGFSKNK